VAPFSLALALDFAEVDAAEFFTWCSQEEKNMKPESVVVALRLSTKTDSKVKAFADITIPLGDDGTVTVFGFSILHGDGRPPRVMPPVRKGKQA